MTYVTWLILWLIYHSNVTIVIWYVILIMWLPYYLIKSKVKNKRDKEIKVIIAKVAYNTLDW